MPPLSFIRFNMLKRNCSFAVPLMNCSGKVVFQVRLRSSCSSFSISQIKYISKFREKLLLNIKDSFKINRQFCTSQLFSSKVDTSLYKAKHEVATDNDCVQPNEQTNSPIVHYASKGVIFEMQESFLVSKNPQNINVSTKPTKNFVQENKLLNDTHKKFSNLTEQERENLEYYEEIGKETSKVNVLVKEMPFNSLEWRRQNIVLKDLPKHYAALAKSRLTGLVVLTTIAGYGMAGAPFELNTFLMCSLGTALISSSANSINQFFEVPFDSQMDRTKNRVLVRGILTPLHAVTFGLTCGLTGLGVLYFGVNEVTAALGGLNILLYTCVYTPMKRVSISNTWIGAIVGAIPPLMGWSGCTGSVDVGAFIIGGVLFAWQFPHFNALSWNLRQDYSRAGYRMMSVTNPELCRRTSLTYSASLIALSTLAPVLDVTTWTFAFDSLPLNLYFTYLAWKFYKEADSRSARKLFRFSLIHLPALLMLMIISKKVIPKSDDKEQEL